MPNSLSESKWMDRFLRRLEELVPGFSAIDAMTHALRVFASGNPPEPEAAAEALARQWGHGH